MKTLLLLAPLLLAVIQESGDFNGIGTIEKSDAPNPVKEYPIHGRVFRVSKDVAYHLIGAKEHEASLPIGGRVWIQGFRYKNTLTLGHVVALTGDPASFRGPTHDSAVAAAEITDTYIGCNHMPGPPPAAPGPGPARQGAAIIKLSLKNKTDKPLEFVMEKVLLSFDDAKEGDEAGGFSQRDKHGAATGITRWTVKAGETVKIAILGSGLFATCDHAKPCFLMFRFTAGSEKFALRDWRPITVAQ